MQRWAGGVALVVWAVIGCGSHDTRATDAGSQRPVAGQGNAGAAGSGLDQVAGSGDQAAIPCTDTEWTQNCGSTCRFDAASLDCATACKNLSSVCATGCPACMGMNVDQATCMLGCATYRSVTCFNRLLGCFTTNSTCQSETACANLKP